MPRCGAVSNLLPLGAFCPLLFVHSIKFPSPAKYLSNFSQPGITREVAKKTDLQRDGQYPSVALHAWDYKQQRHESW